MSNPSVSCPRCGAAIQAEAPQGLCPKCLLAAVAAPTETGVAGGARPAPPTVAEVAAAFPQLDILEIVGQGGMGVVFKARQPKLDRFVALKLLSARLAADAAFAERFTREGRVLARLNHPNIVAIHDFGQAGGFFYLLMEFVDGVNLRQAMKAGRFTPEQALAVVPKVCEALQYAHNAGVLHRDIKPENILLDAAGRVKLADFGIAKLAGDGPGDTSLTGSDATLGTPNYMAPEQIERPGTVDHRADIYSLGVVFYEMLTGELPLGRFAPPSEKSTADPRLDDVVFRALAKEPAERPQSAGEVKTQVETISNTPKRASASSAPSVVGTQRRVSSSRRLRQVLAGVGVALVIAVVIRLFLVQFDGPDHTVPRSDVVGNVIAHTRAEAAAKIVELTGVRPVGDHTNTISAKCETDLLPGETLVAWLRYPDGRMEEATTTSTVSRTPTGQRTSTSFIWRLPGSFSPDQAESAINRFRDAIAEAPLKLMPSSPFTVFSATNRNGRVVAGCVEFKKTSPTPGRASDPAHGTLGITKVSDLPHGMYVSVSLETPPGWALQATVRGGAGGRADSSIHRSSHWNYHSFVWFLPTSTPESIQSGLRQLQQLSEQGAINVVGGEPRLLFSITNNFGEVFEGFAELAGSVPTATTMRTLATRLADGDQTALDELGAIRKYLYDGIDRTNEEARLFSNLALMKAAFDELGQQAGQGNEKAFAALQRAVATKDLRSFAPRALGLAAAAGHRESLQMLLEYKRSGILLSSAVSALQAPAERNNAEAVDFLINVLAEDKHRPLWRMAAQGLQAAAAAGNANARAALQSYAEAGQK